LGNAGAFEHDAHKDKQRYGDQRFIGHRPEVPQDHRAEVGKIEDAEPVTDEAEEQGGTRQAEGHGKSNEEHADDAHEHEAGEDLADKHPGHSTASSASAWRL